jgi:cholinesterase
MHGEDIVSTFYNGQGSVVSEDLIAWAAQGLQGYIVSFAKTGNPNGKGLPSFPKYGRGSMELGLN